MKKINKTFVVLLCLVLQTITATYGQMVEKSAQGTKKIDCFYSKLNSGSDNYSITQIDSMDTTDAGKKQLTITLERPAFNNESEFKANEKAVQMCEKITITPDSSVSDGPRYGLTITDSSNATYSITVYDDAHKAVLYKEIEKVVAITLRHEFEE